MSSHHQHKVERKKQDLIKKKDRNLGGKERKKEANLKLKFARLENEWTVTVFFFGNSTPLPQKWTFD